MRLKFLLFSIVFTAYTGLSAQVYTLPYNQNFSGFPEDNVTFGPGAEPNALVQGWVNIQSDDPQDWYGRSVGTGSSNTGPSADHTTGTGTYMFIEDGFGTNLSIELQAPGIDLTTIASAELTYWAHSRTTQAAGNSMTVKASNDQITWIAIDYFSILSTTDQWFERTADLTQFAGDTVYIIWEGSNNVTGFQHDIGIDDMSIIETVLTATIDGKSDITCNGGSDGWISAAASYGTAPFTYLWNTGETTDTILNKPAGIYCVTIYDASGDSSMISCDTLLEPTMIQIATTSSGSLLCFGDSTGQVTLDSVWGGTAIPLGCGLSILACTNSDISMVDNSTTLLGSTVYPAAFGGYYWGARHQFLYTAAELNAVGVTGGNIDSIGFPLQNLYTSTLTYFNYTVSMGCTELSDLANNWETGLTTVFPAQAVTISLDTVWLTFPTPYYWNGTDNLVIETCFNNSSFTRNAHTFSTDAGFTASRYYRADNAIVCGSTALTGTSNDRPNILFGHCSVAQSTSNAYNYSWSTGDTNVTMIDTLGAGTYVLTVYDASGCAVMDTTVLSNPDTTTMVTTVSNTGADITANQAGATYQWLNCDSNTVIVGDTNATYTATANGNYAVIITIGGCSDTTACVNINNITIGIDDNSSLSNLKVYPNPTNGDVTITNDFTITNISIVSVTGKEVYRKDNLDQKQLKVSLDNYSKGIYYVKVQGGNQLKVIKLIKQ